MLHFMVSVRPGWTWGDERCLCVCGGVLLTVRGWAMLYAMRYAMRYRPNLLGQHAHGGRRTHHTARHIFLVLMHSVGMHVRDYGLLIA